MTDLITLYTQNIKPIEQNVAQSNPIEMAKDTFVDKSNLISLFLHKR